MSPFCLGSGMNRGLIFLLIIRVSLFYSLGAAAFWVDSRWFNIPICFMRFVVRDLGSKCRWLRSAPMVAMRVVDGGNDKARTEPEREDFAMFLRKGVEGAVERLSHLVEVSDYEDGEGPWGKVPEPSCFE